MTNPGDRLPSLPQAGAAEVIRESCPQHGPLYADIYLASLQLYEGEGGTGNPSISVSDEAIEMVSQSSGAVEALLTATTGAAGGARMRTILKANKTSDINPYAQKTADAYLSALGRPANLADVHQAALALSLGVHMARVSLGGKIQPATQSAIVNQFSNTLLARTAKETLCEKYAGHSRDNAEQRAMTIARQYSAMYRAEYGQDISEVFLASKIMWLWATTSGVRHIHGVKDAMSSPGYDESEVRELGQRNTELAQHIQKVRKYGIKPIIFSFSETIPGYDAVFHETSDIEQIPIVGERPIALIQLVPAEQVPEEKLNLHAAESGGYEDGIKKFLLGTNNPLISLDRHGELYFGYGITNSVPLRTLFEHDGAADKYEELRATMLARLFDTIMPAAIVKRFIPLSAPGVHGPQAEQTAGASPEPSDIVGRLILPRIQYVLDHSMKEIGRQVEEALRTEAAEAEKLSKETRWHEMAARLRRLPATAKGASETAIANAKEAWGDEYEIPPGWTFVKKHERGYRTKGAIIGYTAVTATTTPTERDDS